MKLINHYENKICWITGAGSGIGKDLAHSLADLNAFVFISGRNEKKLKSVASYSERIIPLPMDVSDSEQWAKATNSIEAKFGRLDLIIFNAGICEYIDLPQFEAATFKRVFDVNFMGIVHGIENTLPILTKSSSAHIVAVTSSVAILPLPRAEAYGASKSAATFLMNSLRLDTSTKNIAITTVLPGFVETPMTDKNDFPMPFKISSRKAASIILKGIRKKKKNIYFPGKFTWPLRLLSILPTSLQQFFTKRFVR